MFSAFYLLHFLAPAVAVALGAVGIGIGQGIAINGMLEAYDRQPTSFNDINKVLFSAIFLMEGCFILAFIIAVMIFSTGFTEMSECSGAVELSVGFLVGLAAFTVGIACGITIRGACLAVARQPFYARKIHMFLLVILTFIETPAIFAFITAILILNKISPDLGFADAVKFVSAALSVALGCIGPSIAQAVFAPTACEAIAINEDSGSRVFPYIILTEALIEAFVILCFLTTMIVLSRTITPSLDGIYALGFLSVPLTIGIGTIGSSVGIGMIGKKAVKQIAASADAAAVLFRMAFLFQVLIEISGLFAFIVTMSLIFKMSF